MKKYFLGCTAIVLAIALSSFSNKKFIDSNFRYVGASFLEGAVETPANWEFNTSVSCASGTEEAACVIEVNNPIYFHTQTSPAGTFLNDAAYMARPLMDGTGDDPNTERQVGDVQLNINSTLGPVANTYYVVTTTGIADILNKDVTP